MNIQLGRAFFCRVNNACIRNDSRVRFNFFKEFKVVLQKRHIRVFCEYVCGDVKLFAERVRKFYRFRHFLTCEIIGKRA